MDELKVWFTKQTADITDTRNRDGLMETPTYVSAETARRMPEQRDILLSALLGKTMNSNGLYDLFRSIVVQCSVDKKRKFPHHAVIVSKTVVECKGRDHAAEQCLVALNAQQHSGQSIFVLAQEAPEAVVVAVEAKNRQTITCAVTLEELRGLMNGDSTGFCGLFGELGREA